MRLHDIVAIEDVSVNGFLHILVIFMGLLFLHGCSLNTPLFALNQKSLAIGHLRDIVVNGEVSVNVRKF